jgi:hypothetical protein
MIFLIPFMLWMYQNNPHFLREAGQKGVETISGVHNQLAGEEPSPGSDTTITVNSRPQDLSVPVTPADKLVSQQTQHSILGILGSYSSGLAGAILLCSALFGGKKMGLFMLASVLLILCGGSFHIPTFGLVKPEHVGMALGGIVAVAALFLGRDT